MSEKIKEGQQGQQGRTNVEVDLSEEMAKGQYANLAIISHSPTEFVLDFASLLPGMSKAKVNNRVILTPEHAKRLFRSLKDNITRYENSYGEITNLAPSQHQSKEALSLFDVTPKIGEA